MSDYPIEECLATAALLISQGATIHQKFTCSNCGARQTMDEPNKFFRTGHCEECDSISLITHCNYLLIWSNKQDTPNAK
jgi:peptide subunit release factor 1 (eRF1)